MGIVFYLVNRWGAARPPHSNRRQEPEDDELEDGGRRLSVAHQSPEIGGRPSRRKSTTFDLATVGTLTRHGIAPTRGASGVVSKAKINQDRGVVCWPFNGSYNQALLCIFDGHGPQGEVVSDWCMNEIPVRLEANPSSLAKDPVVYMHDTIVAMDNALLSHHRLGMVARFAGTTSTVVYFRGDGGEGRRQVRDRRL